MHADTNRFPQRMQRLGNVMDDAVGHDDIEMATGKWQRLGINLGEAMQVRSCFLERNAAQLRAPQTTHQDVARDSKIVDGESWEQSVPDIETLRRSVEPNGDQGLVGRSRFLCLPQCSLQKLVADATSLITRVHE